jgi:hypothetical protein
MSERSGRLAIMALALGVALTAPGCSNNMAQDEDSALDPNAGPLRENRGRVATGKLLGDDITLQGVRSGSLFSGVTGGGAQGDTPPVNRYLWQASLDTLSFLPLDSTDPFTGVIASEWSSTPDTPRERFKVTVYLTRPVLEASSIKVAVFREALNAENVWVPQAVSPETAARLESAILTRARQLRIAAVESEAAG